MKIIPNYHPPADYRRPTKTQEKVYVPVNDYPEINFSEITNPVLTSSLTLPFMVIRSGCLSRTSFHSPLLPSISDALSLLKNLLTIACAIY